MLWIESQSTPVIALIVFNFTLDNAESMDTWSQSFRAVNTLATCVAFLTVL
jgi:hypothetical protein